MCLIYLIYILIFKPTGNFKIFMFNLNFHWIKILLLGIIMRQWDALCIQHFVFSNRLQIRTLYLVELAKSQPKLPENKSSMRGSYTSLPFIPTPATCRMSSAECPSRCRVEWPSPALCSSFTSILQNSIHWDIRSLPCRGHCRSFHLVISIF